MVNFKKNEKRRLDASYQYNSEIHYLAYCELNHLEYKVNLMCDHQVVGTYSHLADFKTNRRWPFTRVYAEKLSIKYVTLPYDPYDYLNKW